MLVTYDLWGTPYVDKEGRLKSDPRCRFKQVISLQNVLLESTTYWPCLLLTYLSTYLHWSGLKQ